MSNTTENPAKKDPQLEADIALLDRLLGVEARKPGNAAKLPAAIRIIETLEPAGGKQVPVFPASYLGDDDNPTYDLSGIEYGEVAVRVQSKDRERLVRPILRAKLCAVDSPQSQANRTEIAFLEDADLKSLVPQADASLPRKGGTTSSESILTLPHRVADFRMRLSSQSTTVQEAIKSFATGNAWPLIQLMPTSLVFGFWDSRAEGNQHKHARLLLSRIDAHDVVPCHRHAIYSGPYSQTEFAEVILDDTGRAKDKKDTEKMSGQGFTNAVGSALGGVLVEGVIERLSLLSLTDIARINCKPASSQSDADSQSHIKLTNAGRRYLFALATLAEAHPRATGSHRLRSGCELIQVGVEFGTRGALLSEADFAHLKALYFDKQRLIAVATEARSESNLNIPLTLDAFEVTKETLAEKFGTPTEAVAGAGQPSKKPAKKSGKKGVDINPTASA
jgi:CRISPR-associated protein Csb1